MPLSIALLLSFLLPITMNKLEDDLQVSKFFMAALLKLRNESSFIFHTDDHNLETVDVLIRNFRTTVSIYTTGKSYKDMKRAYGVKYVNVVVMVNSSYFEDFLHSPRNFYYSDLVVYIVPDFSVQFWNLNLVERIGVVVMLNLKDWHVYSVFFKSMVPSISAPVHLEEEICSNLRGETLLVSHLNFFPHFYCKANATIIFKGHRLGVCTEYGGYEARLLHVLSDKMNFDFKVVSNSELVVSNTSVYIENIRRGRYDILLGGVTVTYARHKIATFTSYVFFDDFSALYICRPLYWRHLIIPLLPFSSTVWVCLVGLVVAIVAILRRLPLNVSGRIPMSKLLLLYLELVTDRGGNLLQIRLFKFPLATGLVFFCLFTFTITTNTAFKSKLLSIFMRPPHKEPLSLEELIDDKYEIVMQKINLELLDPKEFAQLSNNIILVTDMCQQIRYMLTHRSAILNEGSVLQYFVRSVCKKEIESAARVNGKNRLRLITKPIRANHHAWMLKPNSLLWKPINRIVARLKSGGFIDKWIRDTNLEVNIYMEIPKARNNFPESNDVHFQTYSFLVYFLGKTLAFLVFLFESVHKKCRK